MARQSFTSASTVFRYSPAVLLFACLLLPSMQAQATVCPTTTLDNLIALGTCTIGDATFAFTSPNAYFGGSFNAEWFAGPFVGNSGPGPFADSLMFTPDATAGNPGFTISGNFIARGGLACHYFASCGSGNFYNEALGKFDVSGPNNFVSVSSTIGGVDASPDNTPNSAGVLLIGAAAFVSSDGSSILSGTYDLSPQNNLMGLNAYFTQYNYSSDPNSFISFTSATFNFKEQGATTAPEPSSVILLASGFLAVAAGIRRKLLR
jgi:hypothetical protein